MVDIGCGTGASSIALAERVGPSGEVLGIDVSAPMLARAAARLPPGVPVVGGSDEAIAGKQMTGFPNTEMADFGVAQGAPWLPEERLTQAGAKYIPGQKHKDVVVVDGNLITGQNGASAKRTAHVIISQVNAAARK